MHKTCAMGAQVPRWGEDRRKQGEPKGISKRKGSHPRMEKGLGVDQVTPQMVQIRCAQ